MEDSKNPQKRLKILRDKLRLNAEQFGFRVNVSGGAISNIESGKNGISAKLAVKICQEFSVSLDWLMGLTDVEPEQKKEGNMVTITKDEYIELILNKNEELKAELLRNQNNPVVS